jgi:uncharacterized protein
MNIPVMAAIALTVSLLAGHGAVAAACAGPPQSDGICGDRELMALHHAAEVKLKRLMAAADPLTAMLMRRDQRWLMEVVRGVDGGPFDPKDAPERLRKKTVLEGRLAVLDLLTAGAVPEGVSGRWISALGNAKVEKRGDGIAVEVAAKPDYGVVDGPVECALTAVLKLRPDGWYAGTPAPEDSDPSASGDDKDNVKDAAASPQQAQSDKTELRLRLQGNTLRLVVIRDDDADSSFCTGPEMITGTYFLAGPGGGQAGNPAARIVAPSFDCAAAKNQDEEEICADPDLARLDVEIARTYRDTLRRLDAKLAFHLRNDQRAWTKGNTGAFDTFLHPYWDMQYSFVNQTGAVRSEWETRMSERLAMLANLDETRPGLAGHWLAYNARLTILPAKDKHDGTMRVEGNKWVTGSHKDYCDFDGEGRVVGNGFKPSEDVLPKLRRDGATLTVDGDDPDPDRNGNVARKRPDYCSRLASAKARLFPVKPAAYESKDRIR